MSENLGIKGEKSFSPFLWAVAGPGGLALVVSAYNLDLSKLDPELVILVGLTLLLLSGSYN